MLVFASPAWQTIAGFQRNRIATLLGTTHFERLATLLLSVATCWVLQIQQVRMAWRNVVARTWRNDYNIMQHPQKLHEKLDHFQT